MDKEQKKSYIKYWLPGLFVLLIIIGFATNNGDSSSVSPRYEDRNVNYYDDYSNDTIIYYSEAISYYWDEVREYINGADIVEACTDSGCYSLDADIYSGYIETIYFPNGGYLYFGALIDENGYADGYDQNGNYWSFYFDIESSSLVEDAAYDWAYDYDYELKY